MAIPQYSSHAVHVFRGRACGQRGGGVRGKHPHAMPPLRRNPVQVGLSTVSQPAQQGVHPALGAGVLGDAQLVEDLHCVWAGHAVHAAQVHMSTTCNRHTFQSHTFLFPPLTAFFLIIMPCCISPWSYNNTPFHFHREKKSDPEYHAGFPHGAQSHTFCNFFPSDPLCHAEFPHGSTTLADSFGTVLFYDALKTVAWLPDCKSHHI